MFSGKTTAILTRLEGAQSRGKRVVACKPAMDIRYSQNEVTSHDGLTMGAVDIDDVKSIHNIFITAQVIGIDEAHFFEPALAKICEQGVDQGIRVILAGVDLDHQRRPFEVIRRLKSIAHEVTQLSDLWARCGSEAQFTKRMVKGDARIIIGGVAEYEPRCDQCFMPHLR